MNDLDRAMMVFQTGVIIVCCGTSIATLILGIALCAIGVLGSWYYEKS